MYVSGPSAVARFHDFTPLLPANTQKTHITAVQIDNEGPTTESGNTESSVMGIRSGCELSHQQNALSFQFTGISMSHPDRVQYQYVLAGGRGDTVVTPSDHVSFSNLAPGEYQFLVRSTTADVFSSEPFESFSFSIKPPFSQTPPFRAALLLGICSLLYGLYHVRMRSQRRRQQQELRTARLLNESKILAFQARMNPHFIFNSLNAIQYFILNDDRISSLNYLSKFGRLLRQILDNTVGSKISLQQEIEMLSAYVGMEEMRFDHKFRFELTVEESVSLTDIDIPGMIVQPFAENAILHGLLHKEGEGLLRIHFAASSRQVICTVTDNGIGRERAAEINKAKAANHQSHGTQIAINRLALLNKDDLANDVIFRDLYAASGEPAGTEVTIQIPIL
jgi:two-component sensor histidine kinase